MNNNDFDFENMRQQMTTLKNKLNKQEIVNDRLDSLQLLGIRNAKRFLHSFLDFHLHRHVG